MSKNRKILIVISTLVCLLPIVFSLYLYDRLPEQMPIHWNVYGEPDNYASKAVACFGMPFFMALMNLVVQFVIFADPKRKGHSKAMVMFSIWIMPIMSLIFVPFSLFYSMGVNIPIGQVTTVVVGILFILCGNYMPKSRQNYTIGIKIPWTLNDEQNWNKTHRLAGYLWIFCGVLTVLSSFIFMNNIKILMYIIIGEVFVMVLIPAIYSFTMYKKSANENDANS